MDLVFIALTLLNTPYEWGGNTPEGIDCSGMVCHSMRSLGYIGKKDYTSQQLHDRLRGNAIKTAMIQRNVLLFFGENANQVTHVAIAIDSKFLIEAAGEGRMPTDLGFVRIRPIMNRKDLVGAYSLNKEGTICCD